MTIDRDCLDSHNSPVFMYLDPTSSRSYPCKNEPIVIIISDNWEKETGLLFTLFPIKLLVQINRIHRIKYDTVFGENLSMICRVFEKFQV